MASSVLPPAVKGPILPQCNHDDSNEPTPSILTVEPFAPPLSPPHSPTTTPTTPTSAAKFDSRYNDLQLRNRTWQVPSLTPPSSPGFYAMGMAGAPMTPNPGDTVWIPQSPAPYAHPGTPQSPSMPGMPGTPGAWHQPVYGTANPFRFGGRKSPKKSPSGVPWYNYNAPASQELGSPLGTPQPLYPGVPGSLHFLPNMPMSPQPSLSFENQQHLNVFGKEEFEEKGEGGAEGGAEGGGGENSYGGMTRRSGYSPSHMSLYGSAFPQAAYPGYAAEPGPFARSHAGASYAGANYAGANYVDVCPGPPIQTKPGPDGLMGPSGANLFVFHIPSEFTNVDMYNLFQHYGELVSVRIMTEGGTGRGRGFGFVSFEDDTSAQAAIEALNGMVIGNKRLKVQLKQESGRKRGEEGEEAAARDAAKLPAVPDGVTSADALAEQLGKVAVGEVAAADEGEAGEDETFGEFEVAP